MRIIKNRTKSKKHGNAWLLFEELLKNNRRKYQYPILPEELMRKVDKAMLNKKYYLDASLSIEKLCILINTNRTYLSRSIRIVKNVQFCTYVNTFRVAAAKDWIARTPFESLDFDEIALKVGFSSRRSFGRVFSFLEGCTPRQYAIMLRRNR